MESIAQPHAGTATNRLAPREREIATLVAQGLSNRQIAERLSLSVRTVENVLYSAYCKLRVKNRTTLALLVTLQSASPLADAS